MMRKFVLAAVLVLVAGGAQAATLDVVDGRLMGASGVLVDGSLYDVQFLDGTCIDLYNGCDEASDFTFQTEASAVLASQALLDQVFLDDLSGAFDSLPQLTNGCLGAGNYAQCVTFTPYLYYNLTNGPFPSFGDVSAFNRHVLIPLSDLVNSGASALAFDTGPLPDANFAVWNLVPEPNTALLLSLGLTGLAAKRRRSLRS